MSLHRRLVAFLLIVAVGAVGCTAMKTIRPGTDPSRPMFDDVKTGDTVVLHLRDGRRVEITVAQIESDAVVSAEGVRYPHDDIAQLQKRSVSGVRTVGILTAAFFGFIALIGIALEVLW